MDISGFLNVTAHSTPERQEAARLEKRVKKGFAKTAYAICVDTRIRREVKV
jgi:hypothetical protein